MKKNRRVFNIITFILSLICIFGIVYSLFNIFNWKKDVDSNKKLKEEIFKKIEKKENDEYDIDFVSLKNQNPDTVAYLVVKGTDISYIVVKGSDNEFYLNHDFNRDYNVAGWIFADYHNMFNGSDKNTVIYGHNMKDGSMFGSLKNIFTSSWQEDINNRKVILITETGKYEYEVFSIYSIKAEEYYINTIFNTNDEYFNFLNEIKSRSDLDFGVELNPTDKILTISTCTGTGSGRVVLHARLINR